MMTKYFFDHEMEPSVFCCKWCGTTMEDFENGYNTGDCNGTKGVYHIKYLRMSKQFHKIIQPMIDKLLL